jgi:tetratricopeptide (TPR) repeat protein
MKKKSPGKKPSAPKAAALKNAVPAGKAKPAKAAPAKSAKAKASKTAGSKAKTSVKSAKASPAKVKPVPSKKSPAASKARPAPKPTPSKSGSRSSVPKPSKADSKPAPRVSPAAGRDEEPASEEDRLLRSLFGKDDPAPDAMEKEVLETPVAKEEAVGLEKVMASLTQIFGGRDFLSDAELDAFLDSKIASGEIPPSAALDPLDEAQSLIYEAWNTHGPHKQELARRALDLSKDCADAYVILAEEAKTREAALALLRKGLDAGKRALDPGIFAKSMGKFWDIMETRPYMRARLGLAECLWDLGKREEALEHLRDLMRLNPADDQGVRYILLQCLLESGADDELGALLERYGDDTSPEIKFTHALWMFRRQGPGRDADALLKEAVKANPHVPAFLLKKKQLSKRIHAAAREGSEEEAEAYASGAADTWYRTLGALDWLSDRAPA